MNVQQFLHAWSDIMEGEILSPRNMGIVLWVGLALLTISLVVVSRTRWGQAKPLSKCVALSLYAHVLFMGYAYGTTLIFDQPEVSRASSIRVAVLEAEHQAESVEQTAAPWEAVEFSATAPPAIVSPQRTSLDFQPSVAPHLAPLPTFIRQPEMETLEVSEPTRLEMRRVETEVARITVPAPTSPAVQADGLVPRETVTATRPEARLPDQEAALPRTAADRSAMPATLPTTEPEMQFGDRVELQRLSPPAAEMPQPRELVPTNLTMPDIGTLVDLGASVLEQAKPMLEPVTAAALTTAPATRVSMSLPADRRRLGDGAILPQLYQARDSALRLQVAEQTGGTAETERAVNAALLWLKRAQETDGRWNASRHGAGRETQELGHDRQGAGRDADTGITGLALLAFLAAGNSHLEGEHRAEVRRGIEFLIRSQAKDGNLYGEATLFARMYCHGIALLALSEAFAMTGDPNLETPVRRGVEFTVKAQHPATGGWRYQPGDRGDMSQFGWQVLALQSAEQAGIPVSSETRAGMLKFLQSVTTGEHRGKASYRAGDKPTRTMSAEALTCRLFLHAPMTDAAFEECCNFILETPPDDGRANLYYWYYATLALFHSPQLHGSGGDPRRWIIWNTALQQQLLKRQRTTGELAGSWDTDTVWGGYGGRVYTTAMSALCLEVYYRYLPLYQR